SWKVDVTTAMGRHQSMSTTKPSDATDHRELTDTAGLTTTVDMGADGVSTATAPDGTTVTTKQSPDPRWGMLAPLATVDLTAGSPHLVTQNTSSVTYGADGNPLNVQTLTKSTTINGQTSTSTYDAASHTVTDRSAAGRVETSTLDDHGRITEIAPPGVAPT